MMSFLIVLVSTLLAVGLDARDLAAGEPRPDELRAKAEQLQREAAMLFQHAEQMERSPRPEDRRGERPPIEQLREKIGRLTESIEQLRREGRHDEAEGKQREVEEMKRRIEEMEGPHPDEARPHDRPPGEEMVEEELVRRMIGQMEPRIEQLRREGRHDEAEGMQREVESMRRRVEEIERSRGPDGQRGGPMEHPDDRARILNEAAEHMQEAARRLHDVNMHELADRLMQDAEMVRQEAGPRFHDEGPREPIDRMWREMEQLRRDLEGLRDQVNSIFERLDRPR